MKDEINFIYGYKTIRPEMIIKLINNPNYKECAGWKYIKALGYGFIAGFGLMIAPKAFMIAFAVSMVSFRR